MSNFQKNGLVFFSRPKDISRQFLPAEAITLRYAQERQSSAKKKKT